MEGQLDLTLPHSFVGIRNFCGEKETDHDSHQRRRHLRGQPSSRTTATTTTTTTTTASFTTTTTTTRMLSAAFLLAALSLAPPPSHAAISTTGPVPPLQVGPSLPRLPEQIFRSQLLPCVVVWLCCPVVAQDLRHRNRPSAVDVLDDGLRPSPTAARHLRRGEQRRTTVRRHPHAQFRHHDLD